MKLFKLPPKSEKKDYKFSPAKLVISCVLIAALLISMSIGLSYARYRMKSVPTETTVLSANGIQADGTHTLVFPKAASGDTVMEMFDGNVKITIPSTAKLTSSGVDLTDYIEYFVVDFPSNLPSYTYNYTLTSNQITVDLNVRVRALGRFGMGNLTDTTASEKVEIRVGKDYLGNANTSSGPAYDGSEWITYGNLNRINRSFNTKYDKKDWAEYADTDWYNTTDTSFTISTGAELAGLAAIVNGTADGIDQDSFAGKTITLGDDISLYSGEDRLDGNGEEKRIWIPIGTKTNPFSGTFDGNGNTISGLNICNPRSTSYNTSDQDNSVGLFGYVSGSGSISDVTLDDINIGANIGTPPSTSRQGQSMGALVGRIDDSAAVEISDVHVKNLNISGYSKYIGGILGRGTFGGSISDCSVESAVFEPHNGGQVGGIVGIHYSDGANINLKNCYVSADFGGSYGVAAGIAAFENGGAMGMENCYFTGTFSGDKDDRAGIAYLIDADAGNCIINNCYADSNLDGSYIFGETNDRIHHDSGDQYTDKDKMQIVNSSWSADVDTYNWHCQEEYDHPVYKSDDCTYSAGMSYSAYLAATPSSAPSIYWTITTESEDDDKGTASNDTTDDKIVKENGHTVTLNATAESGFAFDEWEITGTYSLVSGSKLTDASCVIKPSGNITATAKFKQAQAYTITLDNQNPEYGTITADKETVVPGERVTFTLTPNPGYEIESSTIDCTYVEGSWHNDADTSQLQISSFIPTSNVVWHVSFCEIYVDDP